MISTIYPQINKRTETLHLVASTLKSITSSLTITRFDGENTVLNLCVVGTQHHL